MSGRVRRFILRIAALAALATTISFPAFGSGKLQGYAQIGGQTLLTSLTGSSVSGLRICPGATITPKLNNIGAATYKDAALTQPNGATITANSRGEWSFYAANGDYTLEFSGCGTSWSIVGVRIVSGSDCPLGVTCASTFATGGAGTSGDPWTGWEASVNALPANSRLHFPSGYYTLATMITMKSGWRVSGDGMYNSYIRTALAGTAIRSNFALNSGGVIAGITLSDLAIECTNNANTGSGLLLVSGNYYTVERVRTLKFRYGITLNQSEEVHIKSCVVEVATRGGIWLVNGGDYSLVYADIDYSTATPGFTNTVTVDGASELNGNLVNIIDDGGDAHTFADSTINGGTNAIYLAATAGTKIKDNFIESQSGTLIRLTNLSYNSGTAVGPTLFTTLSGGFVNCGGQQCVNAVNGGNVTLVNVEFSSSVTAIVGTANITNFTNQGSGNVGGGALLDATPSAGLFFNAAPTVDLETTQNVFIDKAGSGLKIKEGSNARIGIATLAGGAATVANTSVTAVTRIYVTSQADGGTPGWLRVDTRTPATSFHIQSSNGADTSTVAWLLIEPVP